MPQNATTTLNTENQLNTNYEQYAIFLADNDYAPRNYTNGTGSEITLAAGTVMGIISATDILLPLESDAVDNSQYPVGILTQDVTVANGASKVLSSCVGGEVNENRLVFQNGTDTLATVVDGKTLRDRIAGDTLGILLTPTEDLSEFDNQ